MQSGSWSAAAPFEWAVYGLSGQYGKEGLPDKSQWGDPIHSVIPEENAKGVPQYNQFPFGVYVETMRFETAKWGTEDHFDNPNISRLYSPNSEVLIKTVIFSFKFVSNFAWRTYFDTDGLYVQPYAMWGGGGTVKVLIKQNDSDGISHKSACLTRLKGEVS
jgi:hypothetical protein